MAAVSQVRTVDGDLRVRVDDRHTAAVARELVRAGVDVTQLRRDERQLEDVFFEITEVRTWTKNRSQTMSDVSARRSRRAVRLVRRPAIWTIFAAIAVLNQVFSYLVPYLSYRTSDTNGFPRASRRPSCWRAHCQASSCPTPWRVPGVRWRAHAGVRRARLRKRLWLGHRQDAAHPTPIAHRCGARQTRRDGGVVVGAVCSLFVFSAASSARDRARRGQVDGVPERGPSHRGCVRRLADFDDVGMRRSHAERGAA